jgi:hypothetical protein
MSEFGIDPMRRLFCVVLLALAPVASLAKPYVAENWLRVWPVDATSFEVIEGLGAGARGLWCAAASFAEREMRIDPTMPLYVKQARGPSTQHPGYKGVIFTTDINTLPEDAVIQQLPFAITRTVGTTFPSYVARSFCADRFGDRDRWID